MTPADLATARREAMGIFRAIIDHEPKEVCKDEFAYDRMVENYRDAARKGWEILAATPEPATIASIDLTAIPVHFVTLLPRGRIFMHPDTQTSGVRDPWPPTFTHWTGAATKPDATPEPAPALPEEVAHGEKLPAVVDRFGECLMCGRTYRAGLPAKVAAAARAYTKAVWDHEHCECPNGECIHMVAKRVAAYEVANAAVAAKDGTDV